MIIPICEDFIFPYAGTQCIIRAVSEWDSFEESLVFSPLFYGLRGNREVQLSDRLKEKIDVDAVEDMLYSLMTDNSYGEQKYEYAK